MPARMQNPIRTEPTDVSCAEHTLATPKATCLGAILATTPTPDQALETDR